MEHSHKFTLSVLGAEVKFDSAAVLTTTVACVLVFGLVYVFTRKLHLIPNIRQNILEAILQFIQDIVKSQVGSKAASRFYAFAISLFLFIFFANQMGLMFTLVLDHQLWWKSPTANINVTISLAIAITLVAHAIGFRRSPWGYLKHTLNPLHMVGELTKPVTHGMRLWANIFAGEIMIYMLVSKGSWFLTGVPLIVWLGYSFFVGTVQAYIFTMLAMVYFGQKMNDH